jgi:hypothetical protein
MPGFKLAWVAIEDDQVTGVYASIPESFYENDLYRFRFDPTIYTPGMPEFTGINQPRWPNICEFSRSPGILPQGRASAEQIPLTPWVQIYLFGIGLGAQYWNGRLYPDDHQFSDRQRVVWNGDEPPINPPLGHMECTIIGTDRAPAYRPPLYTTFDAWIADPELWSYRLLLAVDRPGPPVSRWWFCCIDIERIPPYPVSHTLWPGCYWMGSRIRNSYREGRIYVRKNPVPGEVRLRERNLYPVDQVHTKLSIANLRKT